jgi:crotonobetainyl-CoA:carnitine CoA-transferase CaiB-like acyl-CoA transferase
MRMALEGIRVLDWTQFQQGPAATQMLGDLGAEVIKIEDRVMGDGGRGFVAIMGAATGVYSDRNYYYETLNRNKKSITLNLAKERGREVAYRLVERSDVFVHNYRKAVTKKLGMDYDSLRQRNPGIIYAVASGFGSQGPEADVAAFDLVGQAMSGLMKPLDDPEVVPAMCQPGVSDQIGAIMLAHGIVVALLARERLGIGQEVGVSLLGSTMALQTVLIAGALVGIQYPRRTRENVGNPIANYYRCHDDKWICLCMVQSDRHWASFCRAVGREDLATDERYSDMFKREQVSEELVAALDEVFATRPRDEWMKLLRERGDFVIAPVNTHLDLVNYPQVLANDYVVEYEHPASGPTKTLGFPIALSETPAGIRLPAPEWGQHTEEVLIEVGGLSWQEIATLKEEEVI